MISKQDLERLSTREEGTGRVLSVFLDMSVNSDNKRTYSVFVNQKRSQFEELATDREGHHTSGAGEAFDRVERWIRDEYREENRGVAIYAEVGGDWFEALQFPVPVPNRVVLSERPAIAPLAQVLESYQHHGVILLDREHVRILSVYLGTLLDEIEVAGDPWPSPSDVHAGGYAQKRYQRRKAEEMKHFFKEFAKEVEEFIVRYKPDDLVLLGTPDNTSRFRDFLSERALKMIVYTGPMAVDEPAPQVVLAIEPYLAAERERESQETMKLMRERIGQDYLATAGFQSTLTALQEGKVDTLVIAQDQELDGARCSQCGFIFARELDSCPYDGATATGGVNVVEEAVRMAESQGAEVKFVPASTVQDLRGVGALLRF